MPATATAMEPSCINLQLSWEPLKMLTSSSTCSSDIIATLELSDVDIVSDYYNSVLLFYDVGRDIACSRPVPHEHVAAAELPPMMPLQRAIQEMLAHYPCAAGLLVYNETAGRLEVRYPVCSSQQLSDISHIIADAPDQSSHPPATSYGVHFHVAHANVALADLGDVSSPQPSLDVLYPGNPARHLDSKGRPLPRFVMAFQVTTFKCGGFTIGHTCSHTYADGYTAAVFLQNLCSIARGAGMEKSLRVTPSRRTIIRSREPPSPTMPHSYVKAQKQTEHRHYGTATRFKFSMNALEALRASINTPGQFKRCSRNRALVALLWTACARVSLNVGGLPGNHELNLRIPMNLRTRGFSMDYMGNAVCQLSVPATLQELCENPLAYVVDKIEKTMESVDLGGSFQSMVDYVELLRRDGLSPCLGDLAITSLVGLPFYDTDCGWGPPMYVARPSQQLSDGRCIIMDHPIVGAWNVLVVFASSQEHACFQESIAMYINK